MNLERMERWAQMLERLPVDENHRFDLASWTTLVEDPGDSVVECGFSACAMGWLAIDHSFRADGWRLRGSEPIWDKSGWAIPSGSGWAIPSGREYFDLEGYQLERIIYDESYCDLPLDPDSEAEHTHAEDGYLDCPKVTDPLVVAARIREIMAEA